MHANGARPDLDRLTPRWPEAGPERPVPGAPTPAARPPARRSKPWRVPGYSWGEWLAFVGFCLWPLACLLLAGVLAWLLGGWVSLPGR